MKGIEKLIELKKSHKIYFSCGGITLLEKYLKNIVYNKERPIPPIRSEKNDKILILSYLTSYNEIESEIIISNDYKIKDHCSEGASNSLPCVSAFLYCQDVKLEQELEKLNKLLSV